jgi:threonine aldolase
MIIDWRSDTVTKPSKGMLDAMMSAKVGDDVFEEDPTVAELEQKTAAIFGMEAGLFCPSGTMTNQIALKILTQPSDEVICDKTAHIYNYEGGGLASNSLISVRLINGERGLITPSEVEDSIQPDNIHYPVSKVVAVENTCNRGGGSIYTLDRLQQIHKTAKKHNLYYHLDGARVFNALIETQDNPKEYGKMFDTISVCLSKALGAPVGSVLLANKELLKKAKRVRKVFGGGMRQAGLIAAAGIYAIENNINRLTEDHKKAKAIENDLNGLFYVKEILAVETNIVVFKLIDSVLQEDFINKIAEKGIKVAAFGKQTIRLVAHLDIDDLMLEKTIDVLKRYS